VYGRVLVGEGVGVCEGVDAVCKLLICHSQSQPCSIVQSEALD
jgi:hypothetical protein